ncbi:C39 family peptidase [Dactylosporangium sp. NPDC049525]|uniref:C39 family peptidase n=1 Tax=Dactylosporangium sp. NPDC049525 TaxID=3154730 RepID=UPI0034212040
MTHRSIRARTVLAALTGAAVIAAVTGAPTGAGAAPVSTLDAAVARIVAAAPSDAQLASASDAELARLAVRCLPIDGMTYCLHKGWMPEGFDQAALTSQVSAAAADAGGTGDLPFAAGLRRWAGKPRATREAVEKAELAEARAAVGKVVYFDAVAKGRPLPADFATRYPAFASWVTPSATTTAATTSLAAQTFYDTIRSDRAKKQETGYYCGPTSLQAFAWNDPVSPNNKNQAYWADVLNVGPGGSTYVYDLKDAINTYTNWDRTDYAGKYIVISITSWTDADWARIMRNHIVDRRSPVQLHPKLSPAVSSYYPGTTSGHFDVGEGYYINGGNISIFEPAGGAAQNYVYPSLFATETITNVRKANLANTGQRNIAY